MAGINKVILQGNLVADPEKRVTPNGHTVCSFRLAVGRRFAKQGDENVSDFFTVEAWNNTAEFITKYFTKGKQIIIIGVLQNRNWVDASGVKRYGNVIIAEECNFCGNLQDSSQGSQPSSAVSSAFDGSQGSSSAATAANFEEISTEEDLPF